VPSGRRVRAVQVDGRGHAVVGALHDRVLRGRRDKFDLGEGVIPPADVEEQLTEDALCLRQPDDVAGLVGELAYLLGRGDRLLVAVQVAKRRGLVDLQHEPQVGQRGIALGDRDRAFEEEQRVGRLALRGLGQGAHAERPTGGPPVARRLGRRQGPARRLVGGLDVAETAMDTSAEHEQPRPVPVSDTGPVDRAPQRGEGLLEPAVDRPALGKRPMQIHQQVRLGHVREGSGGDLGGVGGVADPVERVGEPAGEQVVRGLRGGDPGDGPAQQPDRGPRRLADELLAGAGEPAHHPLVGGARGALDVQHRQQLLGDPVGGCAVLRQRVGGVAVPCPAHRRRHGLVERRADQWVPEGKLRAIRQ
jgi:hypothetical protein